MLIKKILIFCSVILSSTTYTNAQFSENVSIQFNLGIENPYKYRPVNNASPFFGGFGVAQPFRFFRTKITGVGVLYDYKIPLFKERFSLRGGFNINYMDQYVADTLISPKRDQLLYAIKHRNIHAMTEVGLSIRIFKSLYLTGGLELFTPFIKWINSEQDDFIFRREYSERFYDGNLYHSIGLEYQFDKFSIGAKYQNSGETDHWVYEVLVLSFVDYELQRWMINIRYTL